MTYRWIAVVVVVIIIVAAACRLGLSRLADDDRYCSIVVIIGNDSINYEFIYTIDGNV